MKAQVLDAIISLAREAQVLIFGEVHGTQEVPRLVSQLLDPLQACGYGILGLELPHLEQDHLRQWSLDNEAQPPPFFTHPFGDGRGNEQVLNLIRDAVHTGWQVVCFNDVTLVNGSWRDRDRVMATNLLQEWTQQPEKKVICICGNLHSRLSNAADQNPKLWPSFAANLLILKPETVVKSIKIVFHLGEFYNIRVRKIHGQPIAAAHLSEEGRDGHSIALHLPVATPVTHLAKPLSILGRILYVGRRTASRFMSR